MQVIIRNRLDASRDILWHVDHIQIPRGSQMPVVLYVILNHLEAFGGILLSFKEPIVPSKGMYCMLMF